MTANGTVATPDVADDTFLIRRAQAGDRDAFGELYRQHIAKVVNFLRSQLPHSPADVEDVAAEAFITALSKIDRFSLDESGRFVNWLLSIARHKALHCRRYYATHPASELPDWSAARPVDDRILDPEQTVIDRIEVKALLTRLTPPQREAIVLQYAADVPCEEIARRRATAPGAVSKLTSRARTFLRADRSAPKAPRTALERVLAMIAAAGSNGITRSRLVMNSSVPAARLDSIVNELVQQRLISVTREPTATRPVTRYRTLASAAARRAA